MDLANHLPWGVAVLLVGATFVVAWRYPRTKKLMAALRVPLLERARRPPTLTVLPPPPPLSGGGIAEDRELPPAQLVDSQGNPVGHGPPPENESGSGG